MSIAEILLTAEEYGRLPDDGQRTELVRGRIVPMNMPYPRHGQICGEIVFALRKQQEAHPAGHVVCNDAGVLTERDPDTVRGADVAFYSYARIPPGPFPQGYLTVAPNVIFEVRSPWDRWRDILAKVVEYLDAGVVAVCVLDPMSQTAHVYRADQPEEIFAVDQELLLPEVSPDFRVPVRQFFQ